MIEAQNSYEAHELKSHKVEVYEKHVSKDKHSVPSFSKTFACLVKLHTTISDRKCTKNHNVEPVYEQTTYEVHEELVVSFAYARPQPYAVMIKVHDAVVAHIAMSSSLRSKYHACLAELKPV